MTDLQETGALGSEGVVYNPYSGFEREAYAVSLTIEFELENMNTNPDFGQLRILSDQIRHLTMEDPEAAFQEVLDIGRLNPSDPSAYDGFPTGNDPPRDWREDLRRMGLGDVIPNIEHAAQYSAPPTRPPIEHHAPR